MSFIKLDFWLLLKKLEELSTMGPPPHVSSIGSCQASASSSCLVETTSQHSPWSSLLPIHTTHQVCGLPPLLMVPAWVWEVFECTSPVLG